MQNPVRNSIVAIEKALESINLDMEKVDKGVAKAARRVRKELQVIVKACKEARISALEVIKNKE
jgi:BMFP domain-containing protein YqiC